MASATRKVQVGIGIPLDILNKIDEMRKEKEMSRSALITQLIRQGMKKHCIICDDREQEELRLKEQWARYAESVEYKLRKNIAKDFIKPGNCFTLQDLLVKYSKSEEQMILEDVMKEFVTKGSVYCPEGYGTYQSIHSI